MPSGVTKHSQQNRTYSGTLTIVGRMAFEDNFIQFGAGNVVIESNAVGTYSVVCGYKEYVANGLTDYFHISKMLPQEQLGANPKITGIDIYVTDIVAPDIIDSVKLRRVDLRTGTITTVWEDLDDKSGTDDTIPYTDVDITLEQYYAYWIEVALDAGGSTFRIHGFGITYDLV